MNFDLELAARIAWCIFIVLWAAIRWKPNRKSRKQKISTTTRSASERFSMAVSTMGLGIIPAIWVFTGYPGSLNYEAHWLLAVMGLLVLISSLRLFRITHKALGAMWSHSLDLREGHRLVSSGIYEKIRHPMYSAFWLWAFGQALLIPNFVAGLSGIVGFGTLYFLRVGQEEAMMTEEFGDEYLDYMKRTKRIIPGIH